MVPSNILKCLEGGYYAIHLTICAFLAAKINGQVSPGSTYPARQKSVRDIMNVLRRKFTGAHFYSHVDPMCDPT